MLLKSDLDGQQTSVWGCFFSKRSCLAAAFKCDQSHSHQCYDFSHTSLSQFYNNPQHVAWRVQSYSKIIYYGGAEKHTSLQNWPINNQSLMFCNTFSNYSNFQDCTLPHPMAIARNNNLSFLFLLSYLAACILKLFTAVIIALL
jgi:hypothetical protein